MIHVCSGTNRGRTISQEPDLYQVQYLSCQERVECLHLTRAGGGWKGLEDLGGSRESREVSQVRGPRIGCEDASEATSGIRLANAGVCITISTRPPASVPL